MALDKDAPRPRLVGLRRAQTYHFQPQHLQSESGSDNDDPDDGRPVDHTPSSRRLSYVERVEEENDRLRKELSLNPRRRRRRQSSSLCFTSLRSHLQSDAGSAEALEEKLQEALDTNEELCKNMQELQRDNDELHKANIDLERQLLEIETLQVSSTSRSSDSSVPEDSGGGAGAKWREEAKRLRQEKDHEVEARAVADLARKRAEQQLGDMRSLLASAEAQIEDFHVTLADTEKRHQMQSAAVESLQTHHEELSLMLDAENIASEHWRKEVERLKDELDIERSPARSEGVTDGEAGPEAPNRRGSLDLLSQLSTTEPRAAAEPETSGVVCELASELQLLREQLAATRKSEQLHMQLAVSREEEIDALRGRLAGASAAAEASARECGQLRAAERRAQATVAQVQSVVQNWRLCGQLVGLEDARHEVQVALESQTTAFRDEIEKNDELREEVAEAEAEAEATERECALLREQLARSQASAKEEASRAAEDLEELLQECNRLRQQLACPPDPARWAQETRRHVLHQLSVVLEEEDEAAEEEEQQEEEQDLGDGEADRLAGLTRQLQTSRAAELEAHRKAARVPALLCSVIELQQELAAVRSQMEELREATRAPSWAFLRSTFFV